MAHRSGCGQSTLYYKVRTVAFASGVVCLPCLRNHSSNTTRSSGTRHLRHETVHLHEVPGSEYSVESAVCLATAFGVWSSACFVTRGRWWHSELPTHHNVTPNWALSTNHAVARHTPLPTMNSSPGTSWRWTVSCQQCRIRSVTRPGGSPEIGGFCGTACFLNAIGSTVSAWNRHPSVGPRTCRARSSMASFGAR